MSETIYFVMELIGTVAFSISGALVAIDKKMDVFGVICLGITTSVGGGIIRDLILGITPPSAFIHPIYMLVAAFVALAMFIPAVRNALKKDEALFDRMLLVMDAIGLGIFTCIGIRTGYTVNGSENVFLLIFVGVVTGVGGGVCRDLFAQSPPFIFRKHFYACASIAGSVMCIALWDFAGSEIAMISGVVSIVLLRCLAARFRWTLPRA